MKLEDFKNNEITQLTEIRGGAIVYLNPSGSTYNSRWTAQWDRTWGQEDNADDCIDDMCS